MSFLRSVHMASATPQAHCQYGQFSPVLQHARLHLNSGVYFLREKGISSTFIPRLDGKHLHSRKCTLKPSPKRILVSAAAEKTDLNLSEIPKDVEAVVKIDSLWTAIDPSNLNSTPTISPEELESQALSAYPGASLPFAESESVQKSEISKRVDAVLETIRVQKKRVGRAQGDGKAIPFSQFWHYVQGGVARYLEYGDNGRVVAVILPHPENELHLRPKATWDAKAIEKLEKSGQPVVWIRHKVMQMPADAHTDLWASIRAQTPPTDIIFTYPTSPWAQTLPTLQLTVIWVVRLVLGFMAAYVVMLAILEKFKPRTLKQWPKFRTETVSMAIERQRLGSLGQSRARLITAEERTGTTLDDFAGQAYVKREVKELVRILKGDPEYMAMGVYCPRGLMLHGPPGTGKTLLARGIAGDAGLPFFSASGAEFVEMFAGVAAARVKDLFARAREFSPAIIFIDEIDAIGMARGTMDSEGGSLEREQGLIQILTEMDGFRKDTSQLLVIGATNRVDLLDPALLRKGRFDKILHVGKPTLAGRYGVLKVHSRNKTFRSEEEKDSILHEIATICEGFSGAELMNVLNEASILTARYDKDFLERSEVLEAIQRQEGRIGIREEEYSGVHGLARVRLAYREAANCVLECFYPLEKRPLAKVDMRKIEDFTNLEFEEPRFNVAFTKQAMIEDMVKKMAPALIQDMIFGASSQIFSYGESVSAATQMADYIILQTGQTSFGPIIYITELDLVPAMQPKLIALREEFVRYATQKCEAILVECEPAVEKLAALFQEKDEISADEIWSIFNSTQRNPAPYVRPIDEWYPLIHTGRWGVPGASLPGRATFFPGNSGYATFGAPRPYKLRNMEPAADVEKFLITVEEEAVVAMAEKERRARLPKLYGDLLLTVEDLV